MSLKPETGIEWVLTHLYKDGMIAHVREHPEDFVELARLALLDRQPYSWRAAWLLWSCMEPNDPRLRVYIPEMIRAIPGKKSGHQRELLKILSVMEIDEELEGYLFDLCVTLWEQIHHQPSVRYTALRMIFSIADRYPELKMEIDFLTGDHYLESLSPGVRNAVERMRGEHFPAL